MKQARTTPQAFVAGSLGGRLALCSALVATVACAPMALATAKPVKKFTRTVTFDYRGGCTVAAEGSGAALTRDQCASVGGGATIDARKGERYVTVKVMDDHGVAALQVFPNDPSVYASAVQFVCGSARSMLISQDTEYNFFLQVGVDGGCAASAPTTGKVIVTFSNRP